jgi:hypothetical protein
MSVRKKDDPALYAKIEEQNLLRQYDLLTNCIEIGLAKGIEAFDKYTLWALNYAAVSNICQLGDATCSAVCILTPHPQGGERMGRKAITEKPAEFGDSAKRFSRRSLS